MKVGEVIIPTDHDFQQFKTECISDQGWTICYEKSTCRVSTKKNSLSAFDAIRVKTQVQSEFNSISAELLYDAIHDGQFRSVWDTAMLEAYDICSICSTSDIGYYSVKSPRPFKNRDFVTQRYWLNLGPNQEKYIINHSVNHLREPVRKHFVRGISYLSGYFIIPKGPSSCTFYYMTQGDPGGNLPAWAVNRTSKVLVPKMVKKLAKACPKYEKWKAKNQPSFKPWLYPEQLTLPRVNPADIGKLDAKETLTVSGDNNESTIGENSVSIDDFGSDD